MSMKFGRAYCVEIDEAVSPYRARELYTDEDGDRFGSQLTFRCEDPACRARLTPVGIYMVRKSKRALHFRSNEEHQPGCAFMVGAGGGGARGGAAQGDDYKPNYFPTQLDLDPRKRSPAGGTAGQDDDDGAGSGMSGGYQGGARATGRKTGSRTRYLDLVVDCFLSGDEQGLRGLLTIGGKTRPFARFFKKIPFFADERGLIYYGPIDRLSIYAGKQGIGIRFSQTAKSGDTRLRVWVNIPQDVIDRASRKTAFLAEMEELKQAVENREEVLAFFVGAYPEKKSVAGPDGAEFDLYSATLASIHHLSLAFAKDA